MSLGSRMLRRDLCQTYLQKALEVSFWRAIACSIGSQAMLLSADIVLSSLAAV